VNVAGVRVADTTGVLFDGDRHRQAFTETDWELTLRLLVTFIRIAPTG
jgi:hypothetical protein